MSIFIFYKVTNYNTIAVAT